MVDPDTRWCAVELREECREALVQIPNCEVVIGDFRSVTTELADVALFNPPYRLAQEFVVKSMTLAKYVVALLRLNFLGSDLRADWLRTWTPDVKVLPNRPKFRAGPGTDSIEYAWMVWDSGVPSASGTICVLPPTSKAERGVRVRGLVSTTGGGNEPGTPDDSEGLGSSEGAGDVADDLAPTG
jgi:hypothetical protein